MGKGINIPLTISGLKEAKKELKELEKNLQNVDKASPEGKKMASDYDALANSIDKVNQEIQETSNQTLTAKQRLRELEDQLADMADQGSAEFRELAAEAGQLRDRINNARAAVNASADDFPRLRVGVETMQAIGGASQVAIGGFQAFGVENENLMAAMQRLMAIQSAMNGLQAISNALSDESALGLAVRRIQADGLAVSLKRMGAAGIASFGGLIKGIGSLGSAFLKFGASLLLNPIFLITAVIAAIVAGIVMLLDHFGFLQPILDAIGKAFDMLIAPIKLLIQKFKELTDWLGLTNFAEEELAAERQKRAEENLKNIDKQSEKEQKALDRKIELAAAEGKSTVELEKQKQEAIIETAKQRLKETAILWDSLKIQGKLTEEKAKEINDLRRKANEQYLDASHQLKVNEIKNAKEVKDKEAEVLKERANKYKEYQKNRFDTARLIQDLEIQMMEEGEAKELAALDLKYARLIEDTKLNETILQSEKNQIIANYETLRQQELDKREADKQKKQQEQQEKDAKFLEDSINKQLEIIEGFQEEAYQLSLTDQEREEEALRTKYENQLQLARDYGQSTFEIEAAYAKEKAAMEDKYRKEKLAKDQAVEDAKLQLASDGLSAVSQLTELFANKSEKAAKRAFAIQKAISIAQAVMDTYKGANAIFASAAANPQSILFPAQPFIAAGIAITSGLANVAKIASSRFEGGSTGGGSAPSAPSFGGGGSTSSSSSTPSFELFGQPNEDNNVSAPQSQETTQMTVKAVVVESDITSTQNKIEKMQKNAEL